MSYDKKVSGGSKPDPVKLNTEIFNNDDHLSKQPEPGIHNAAGSDSSPIWPCFERGFPCPFDYSKGGELLPHLFTLTPHLLLWKINSHKSRCGAVYSLLHFPFRGI